MSPSFLDLAARAVTTFVLLLFVQALTHKLVDFVRFSGYVSQYRMLPQPAETPAALGLVLAEAALVAWLLVAPDQPGGLYLATGLLLMYALAIGLNVWRGRRHIDCGCGGPAQTVSWQLVLRNLLLAAAALATAGRATTMLATSDTLLAVLAGALLWFIYCLAAQVLVATRPSATSFGGLSAAQDQ